MEYDFTAKLFEGTAKNLWDNLIPQIKPTRVLEIGSYEGASASYLIENAQSDSLELHCVDTWEGGIEHKDDGFAASEMNQVEKRFHNNTLCAITRSQKQINLVVHKGNSGNELAKLISLGFDGYFDFIYVDGSHQAPDVLLDAVLGFKLLKVNGIMAFDDYLWFEPLAYGLDPVRCPKMAVDAFTNSYCRKLRILQAPLYQIYVKKISD